MEASDSTAPAAAQANGASGGQSPWDAHIAAQSPSHPELPVIGAFVGGFILAKLLHAIGGGDD
jgi:hypothetical protein